MCSSDARTLTAAVPAFVLLKGYVQQDKIEVSFSFKQRSRTRRLRWIPEQASRVFGTQAGLLVDFYHVYEYLGEAAQSCSQEKKEGRLQEQKHNLKTNDQFELHPLFPLLLRFYLPNVIVDCL